MMPTTLTQHSLEWKQSVRWVIPASLLGCGLLLLFGLTWTQYFLVTPTWQGAYILCFAFLMTLFLTPLTIHFGHKWNFLDTPDSRKIHQEDTPRLGGVAVYGGLICALWIGSDLAMNGMGPILFAGTLLFMLGIIDDKGHVPAWIRLTAQVACAALVISTGTVLTLFPPSPLGQAANILITLLWIVGIMNAFNFFDGMDGLATGLAILMALFLGLIAVEAGQMSLALVAFGIMGAGLGFLPYNLRIKKQALVFMGDCGSTFLGFTLACLAVKGDWADGNPIVSFSNPLLIFGVLIYDMIHITVERIFLGKVRSLKEWIDYVGKDHLHHRWERALGSRLASVVMIFALTISLSFAALVLRKAGTFEAVLLLAQAVIIVIMVTVLEHAGRRTSQPRP